MCLNASPEEAEAKEKTDVMAHWNPSTQVVALELEASLHYILNSRPD